MAGALREQVNVALDRFDVLSAAADPDAEPYKSKYAARELLLREVVPSLEQRLRDGSVQAEDVQDLLCIARSRLGQNYVQCEENGSAEEPLASFRIASGL